MANEMNLLNWTFFREVDIPDDITTLLVENEKPVASFATIRDVAVFTNKRLIVKDAQGITGKKVEIYSLPYSSILMWSTENAGKLFDLNAEVELWTKVGKIKINLKKDIDIRKFDTLLAQYIL
ncbi:MULTISPECIES: PH domain-containing protein [Gemella]|jgi:superfamily I DNA/RNA helicase|uniref:PH domain-containing protein n=1 Tax=Gemella TaxID=1378 RepID=UPI001CB1F2C9|nr:PH domain-containing protein [Gemella morbillorum]MBF1212777.1 PH domain-containing protein [Gemella morbillorum]